MTATTHVPGALLLYHRPAFFPDAATITDHINAFERYSRFPFWTLNTDLGFRPGLAELRFDAIVVHYTVFASGPSPYLLDEGFLSYLDAADRSYKVAFFQDEHQYCRKRFTFLDRFRFDCVYTCVEPEHFDATYGHYTRVPTLVSHAPAYVHPDMVAKAEELYVPDQERPIDIGYRARPTPPFFGRGGLEKVEIGERFDERVRPTGLVLDISMREEDRLYGEDWYRFVASCRGFLGTESGSSCIDLEDEVREEFEILTELGDQVTIEDLERRSLGRWDGKVPLRSTSSRHFEAAALRVCQVMYEGRYSDSLRPMEHYIPLKKDFSNFDEVIQLFKNPSVRRELTENAYRDLIASGEFSYERFIAGFDETLTDADLVPPTERADPGDVSTRLQRKYPGALGVHYVGGAMYWLHRNHPRLHRLARPMPWLLWLLSRPVVVPARWLIQLLGRLRPGRAEPQP